MSSDESHNIRSIDNSIINNINPKEGYTSNYKNYKTKINKYSNERERTKKTKLNSFTTSSEIILRPRSKTTTSISNKPETGYKPYKHNIKISQQFINLLIPHKSYLVNGNYFERVKVTPNCLFNNRNLRAYEKIKVVELIETARNKKNNSCSIITDKDNDMKNKDLYIPVKYSQLSKLKTGGETFFKELKSYVNGVYPGKFIIPENLKTEYHGRVTPIGGLGYCSISRTSRPTIYYNMIEIDIVNCHPTIIYEICKMLELNLPMIYQYINDREKHLEILSKYYGTTKDDIKELLITLMYVSMQNTLWRERKKITKPDPEFIVAFANEMSYFRAVIQDFIQKAYANDYDIQYKKSLNFVIAYFLQNIEIRILEKMYEFCKSKGYIKSIAIKSDYSNSNSNSNSFVNEEYISGDLVTFCHDGILLPSENVNDNYEIITKEMSEYVFIQLGLKINFKVKIPTLKPVCNTPKSNEPNTYKYNIPKIVVTSSSENTGNSGNNDTTNTKSTILTRGRSVSSL